MVLSLVLDASPSDSSLTQWTEMKETDEEKLIWCPKILTAPPNPPTFIPVQ